LNHFTVPLAMLSISLPNTIKVHRIAVLVQIPKACDPTFEWGNACGCPRR
jgi:hypothetical protein